MSEAYGLNDALPFGKYKGLSIGAIARFDPMYLLWIKRNLDRFHWQPAALEVAKKAWTRAYYATADRQNAWAWGFGAGAKSSVAHARHAAIKIEAEERRKAGIAADGNLLAKEPHP